MNARPMPGTALGFRCQAHRPHWPHRMAPQHGDTGGLTEPRPILGGAVGMCWSHHPTLSHHWLWCLLRAQPDTRQQRLPGAAAVQAGFSRMMKSFLVEEGQGDLPVKVTSRGQGKDTRTFGNHRFDFFLVVLPQRFSHQAPEKTLEANLSLF